MHLRKVVLTGFLFILVLLMGYKVEAQAVEKTDPGKFKEEYALTRGVLENEKASPWFKTGYHSYKPDASIVSAMKDMKKHVNFTVIGGRWCSDTQNLLPQFIKFADEAGYAKKVKMIGVDEDKKDSDGKVPFAITNVPTVIIYYDGKEVGRVVETVQQSIEADIYGQIMSYLDWINKNPH